MRLDGKFYKKEVTELKPEISQRRKNIETYLITRYNMNLSFAQQLTTEEKRKEISTKISEMAKILNQIDPIDDIIVANENYTSEDEYLCYLNGIIYNLENKIGNIFKSIS